jgi:hypothetical protein
MIAALLLTPSTPLQVRRRLSLEHALLAATHTRSAGIAIGPANFKRKAFFPMQAFASHTHHASASLWRVPPP